MWLLWSLCRWLTLCAYNKANNQDLKSYIRMSRWPLDSVSLLFDLIMSCQLCSFGKVTSKIRNILNSLFSNAEYLWSLMKKGFVFDFAFNYWNLSGFEFKVPRDFPSINRWFLCSFIHWVLCPEPGSLCPSFCLSPKYLGYCSFAANRDWKG